MHCACTFHAAKLVSLTASAGCVDNGCIGSSWLDLALAPPCPTYYASHVLVVFSLRLRHVSIGCFPVSVFDACLMRKGCNLLQVTIHESQFQG